MPIPRPCLKSAERLVLQGGACWCVLDQALQLILTPTTVWRANCFWIYVFMSEYTHMGGALKHFYCWNAQTEKSEDAALRETCWLKDHMLSFLFLLFLELTQDWGGGSFNFFYFLDEVHHWKVLAMPSLFIRIPWRACETHMFLGLPQEILILLIWSGPRTLYCLQASQGDSFASGSCRRELICPELQIFLSWQDTLELTAVRFLNLFPFITAKTIVIRINAWHLLINIFTFDKTTNVEED